MVMLSARSVSRTHERKPWISIPEPTTMVCMKNMLSARNAYA
jgi:hypothetical protein